MIKSKGFVSLLTTIIISLLLLVVTLSMVTLEALQLRKAEDSEQSLRAYYTAEAGVEDAVSKVLSNAVSSDTTCGPSHTLDALGAAGWTCQKISFSVKPTGKLQKPDEAKTIDPGLGHPYQSVLVEWGESIDPNASRFNFTGGAFPADGAWSEAIAPIELSIAQYPGATFASNDPLLTLQNALIQPKGPVGQVGATVNYGSLPNHGPWDGDCRPARVANPFGPTKYNCYALITGFAPNRGYIFRIRSRYLPSSYQFTFFTSPNGTGLVNGISDGTATIDVTAKAGQTYRRVISKLPLNAGAAAGLNYVMYSDTDICKNFEVIDNTAQPGCPY